MWTAIGWILFVLSGALISQQRLGFGFLSKNPRCGPLDRYWSGGLGAFLGLGLSPSLGLVDHARALLPLAFIDQKGLGRGVWFGLACWTGLSHHWRLCARRCCGAVV